MYNVMFLIHSFKGWTGEFYCVMSALSHASEYWAAIFLHNHKYGC